MQNEKKSFSELINQDVPVLVDFSAEWCGPCKAMAPVLKEVASRAKGKAKIIKIDVDKNPQLAEKLGIRAVPTFILYHKGKPKWRHSGMQSVQSLLQVIERAANEQL